MKPQAPAAPVALRPPRVALCRVFFGRENSMDVDLPKMPWKMSIFCFTSTFRDMSEIENLSVWWRRMAVNALFWCAVNMNVPIISEGCVCLSGWGSNCAKTRCTVPFSRFKWHGHRIDTDRGREAIPKLDILPLLWVKPRLCGSCCWVLWTMNQLKSKKCCWVSMCAPSF